MMESAMMVKTCIDVSAIDNYDANNRTSLANNRDRDDDIDMEDTEGNGLAVNLGTKQDCSTSDGKLLPYGSGLLPSSSFRGGGLESMPIDEIEKNVSEMLDKSAGVLGVRNNPNVPKEYRKWESDREKLRTLQGEAQQLRNAVFRQKRIRFLNEKNATTAQNRRGKFEKELFDMNSDLDTMKERLNEELKELGIDQTKARQLLAEYYKMDEIDDACEKAMEKRKIQDDDDMGKTSRRKIEVEPGFTSAQ